MSSTEEDPFSSKEISLYSPSEGNYDETTEGLLFPKFFLTSQKLAIIALPMADNGDHLILGMPYKIEVMKDSDGLYTGLRVLYPKPTIEVYKSNLAYSGEPIVSAESRYIGMLLTEKKRILQRLLFDFDIPQEEQIEFLKRRRMHIESTLIRY